MLPTSRDLLTLVHVFHISNIADESNKLPADIPSLILEWDLHSKIWPLLRFRVTIKFFPRDINLVIFALEKHIWQILNDGRRQDRNAIALLSSIGSWLLHLFNSLSSSLSLCSDLIVTVVLDSYSSSDGKYHVSDTSWTWVVISVSLLSSSS